MLIVRALHATYSVLQIGPKIAAGGSGQVYRGTFSGRPGG